VKYYLIEDYQGVDLALLGPFENENHRVNQAASLKRENGEDYEYFELDIFEDGVPQLGAFANDFELEDA